MSHNGSNNAQSGPYTVTGGEYSIYPPAYYPWLDASVRQPNPGALSYIQPFLSVPWQSPIPHHMYLFNVMEDQDCAPLNARHYPPNSFITPAHDWEYQFQPCFPTGVSASDICPPTAIGLDAVGTHSAPSWTDAHPTAPSPFRFMSIATVPPDHATSSSIQTLGVAPGTGLPTTPGAAGPSIATVSLVDMSSACTLDLITGPLVGPRGNYPSA